MSRPGWRTVLIIVIIMLGALWFSYWNVAAAKPRWQTVGSWQMNEQRGDVLRDYGPLNLDGRIGRYVEPNGTAHVFPFTDRTIHERQPGHIDRIGHRPVLNPGGSRYAVTVQVKYRNGKDRNIIQKGQGSPEGGMWKIKVDWDHQVYCLFRGSTGDSTVVGPDLGDGRWHTIRCVTGSAGTSMRVDGQPIDSNPNVAGQIANDWPVTVGGNSVCWTGSARSCNYWWGRIGSVEITTR